MSSIKLDLSQFKHVRSDDKTTTLQHRDGHELTLAHKSLSPSYQKQLSALSKIPMEAETKSQAQEERQKYAQGSNSVHQAVGHASMQEETDPGSTQQEHQPISYDTHSVPDKTPAPQKGIIKVQQPPQHGNSGDMTFAQGGPVAKYCMYCGGMAHGGECMAEGGVAGQSDLGKIIIKDSKKDPKDFGKVTVKEEKKKPEGHGNIYDKAGPGKQKPKVYAEGTAEQPVAQDDSAPVIPSPQDAPQVNDMLKPQMPEVQEPTKVDPILQSKRDRYNQIIGGNPGNPGAPMTVAPAMLFGPNGEPPKNFNPDIWQAANQNVDAQAQGQQAAKEKEAADVSAYNASAAQAGIPTKPLPPVPPSAAAGAEGVDASPPPPVQNPNTGQHVGNRQPNMAESTDPESLMHSGYSSKLAGIQQEEQARSALGAQEAGALNKNIESQQKAQTAYQSTYNELEQERQLHMDDIQAGHIDPNKYWTGWTDSAGNEHGGHSKIAAGIGMILAGFNPTNNPNAAISYLKHQMDMNLEAQKQNLSSDQNLLAANLRQFGNLKDATDMTRLMQSDIMQNQLKEAAAKAQAPLAKAAALQAAGQLKIDSAPMFQNFAMRRAMIGLATNPNQDPQAVDHMLGYMRVSNPEMAKEMESRYVPGSGLASVPVPAEVRQRLVGFQNLQNQAQDLLNFTRKHTTIVPGTPEYNVGAQKALVLQSAIREGQLGTVYKAGEQPLLDKFVNSNPAGAMKMLSTQPQLQELIKSNARQMNAVKQSYGLPVQQQQNMDNAPIKGKDGKMYIRQGNYMVPYKGK